MALSQAAVIKLILKYIGGSKIKGSSTFTVDGKPAMIKNSTLSALASKLGQFGTSDEEIRNAIFQNPKAAKIAEARDNLTQRLQTFQNNSSIDPSLVTNVEQSIEALNTQLDRYLLHTNILSGLTVVDEIALESQEMLDEIEAFTYAAEQAANLANSAIQATEDARDLAELYANNAFANANLAEGFADTAQFHSSSANSSAAAAETASVTAAGAANTASGHATAAGVSATTAEAAANSSSASADAASVSLTAANIAANNAQDSASAAASSAEAASVSANSSATSASAAEQDRLDAQTASANASASETAAAGSATSANGSAAAALISEGVAAAAANTAGGHAQASADFAAAAEASANSSSASASAADQDRIAAETASASAETSKNRAVQAEESANGSAIAAATSETNAAQSVVDATSQATAAETSATSANTSAAEARVSSELSAAFSDFNGSTIDLGFGQDSYFTEGQTASPEALALEERSVRATADAVIARDVSSLDVRLGTAEAGITAEQTARADADSALATDVSNLTATVNTKGRTFSQTSAPTADAVGDLWIDTDDDNHPYRWNGSSWISIRDGTISDAQADAAQAITNAATAQATADGKVTTFVQTSAPTAEGEGDLWMDTDDGNKLYRWNGSAWAAVQDAGIQQAITNAATAQTTADGKIVSFYQTSAPTASGVGDFWIDTDDSNKLYRWSGSAWVSARDAGIAANEAAITNEQTARVNADNAIASDVTTLTTRVGDAETAITDEQTARSDADAALATDVQQVSASFETGTDSFSLNFGSEAYLAPGSTSSVEAAVLAERSARASKDEAIAQDITTLTTRIGDAEADITNEQTARTNADAAIASDVTTLTTRVGNAETDITNEQTARTNADNAIASDVVTLTSRVDTNEANITTTQSTVATLEGAAAHYETVVSASGSNNAVVTLKAGSGGSEVALAADRFLVRNGANNVPALYVANGSATFSGELNVGVGTGARVNITKNLVRVYDANNTLRVRMGIWS